MPSILTSPENCVESDAVSFPTLRSANPSTVTDPAVVPSSEFVETNANESVDSCHIRDLFNVLVVIPSPRVNTIPKSWVAPIFPSPNLIILSATVKLVAWVVTTFPDTVRSPTIEVSPLTVRLSPTVTSEVVWPRLITASASCVPILIAPDDLILALVPSKYKFISELLPKFIFLPSANFIESALNWPTVSTTTSWREALPVKLSISESNTPIVLWSDEIVVTPFNVFNSTLSPFSPLLSLTNFTLGVPSEALFALINTSGFSVSISMLPETLSGFITVSPPMFVVVILPGVNVISPSVELAPPVIGPLILIPALVVISPSKVTFPPKIALPDTLTSPSNKVSPSETRKAFELLIVMLFPAEGEPFTCNVDAFVVVTLVNVDAIDPLFNVYKSVESITDPAPAELLV